MSTKKDNIELEYYIKIVEGIVPLIESAKDILCNLVLAKKFKTPEEVNKAIEDWLKDYITSREYFKLLRETDERVIH